MRLADQYPDDRVLGSVQAPGASERPPVRSPDPATGAADRSGSARPPSRRSQCSRVGSAHAAGIGLGTADSYGVLAGSTVTNTGPSTILGDLGVAPGTAVSGFPAGTVTGTTHANDANAQQAASDLVTANDDAAGRPTTATVTADLAGRTLVSGVYTAASSLRPSGALTLDAKGDPDAVFVFQAGSALTAGAGSRVRLVNGAQACNVFWQVGSSATIGTASAFTGTIPARTSISLTTGATLDGRAFARDGAVTLDSNTVRRSTRATSTTSGLGTPGGTLPADRAGRRRPRAPAAMPETAVAPWRREHRPGAWRPRVPSCDRRRPRPRRHRAPPAAF